MNEQSRNPDMESPLISLCTVMENNAAHLPVTLSSAGELVDEIVAVDLESKDGSRRIAGEFDARVLEYPRMKDRSEAWNTALRNARGRWILQLNPGQEIVVDNIVAVRDWLSNCDDFGFYLKDYALDNPDDYYYLPNLYRNLPANRFEPYLEMNPVSSLSGSTTAEGGKTVDLLPDILIFNWDKRLLKRELSRKRSLAQMGLEINPGNIKYYYYLAFYNKAMNAETQFQQVVQDGIESMTHAQVEDILTTPEAGGLFGFFADSLLLQEPIAVNAVESLVQLHLNLNHDVRLSKPLAMLLYRQGETSRPIKILERVIASAFQPCSSTVTFFESFIEPVMALLEIVSSTDTNTSLLNKILATHMVASAESSEIRTLFNHMYEHRPDLFSIVEEALKHKLEGVMSE